jgi:hypothetical protein
VPLLRGILSQPSAGAHPAEGCISLSSPFFQSLKLQLRNVLNYLKLHTLSAQRRYLDVLSLTNVFSGLKYCLALLETFGLRVPNRNFLYFI